MEKKKFTISLRDVILGGQDGLVNVLGISLGLFAAHAHTRLILVAGLAAGLSEAVSMGAVAYTSSLAQADYYKKAKQDLSKSIVADPMKNKQIVDAVLSEEGFSDGIKDRMVHEITASEPLEESMIMSEGMHLQPVNNEGIVFSSTIVGISALIGSLFPLIPFLFHTTQITSILFAIAISACILFAVGAYKAATLVGTWWKSGLQMLAIGLLSALAGFFIGLVLKVN